MQENNSDRIRCNTTKNPESLAASGFFIMVEVGGVEPPSESTSLRLSPGADRSLEFPRAQVKGQTCAFGSFIVHGALKALRTHVHR